MTAHSAVVASSEARLAVSRGARAATAAGVPDGYEVGALAVVARVGGAARAGAAFGGPWYGQVAKPWTGGSAIDGAAALLVELTAAIPGQCAL